VVYPYKGNEISITSQKIEKASNLFPRNNHLANAFENKMFVFGERDSNEIYADKPLCLDLGTLFSILIFTLQKILMNG